MHGRSVDTGRGITPTLFWDSQNLSYLYYIIAISNDILNGVNKI